MMIINLIIVLEYGPQWLKFLVKTLVTKNNNIFMRKDKKYLDKSQNNLGEINNIENNEQLSLAHLSSEKKCF